MDFARVQRMFGRDPKGAVAHQAWADAAFLLEKNDDASLSRSPMQKCDRGFLVEGHDDV